MEKASQIKKLEESVINRIAAGEVIQRPANALKEMIENSIDAKSNNIQITVKHGGLKYIQIQDNGSGIRKDDFEIVCERFTTSKLRQFEDLSSISTYGFRGEALASISHVAHLTIQSKTVDQQCAYKAYFIDGKLKGCPKAVAGNQGTQITVEDLFYNMDIRKRALKSASEEYQKISDVVGKYAIHNASIGFGLKKFGENNNIRTPPGSNHIDNIRTIYGNLIARELIEFKHENGPFQFQTHGYMTNVNYSTKNFTFLLFINDRLVSCQSLKKCIDQIYTTYLPKNMHPFVYLSLKLNPSNVDVNVHPTKHEVNFLNEEQIVDIIGSAMETKLLGSNNSRMFYMQAKLPVLTTERSPNKDPNTTIHDKHLVRTDAAEQKLDKFFGPIEAPDISSIQKPTESISKLSTSKKHDSSGTMTKIKQREKFVQIFGSPKLRKSSEKLIQIFDETPKSVAGNSKTVEAGNAKKKSPSCKPHKNPFTKSLFSKIDGTECKLTSILELRKEVEQNCHSSLRELFAQHVYVGAINSRQALVQHNTKLYLCNTENIVKELFYQFVLYNFNKFGAIQLSDSLSIHELALIALDMPETGWTQEDGEKEELAQKVTEILTEKGEMLRDYFSMEIDELGHLKSLPVLHENHVPEMVGLPMYILRLATEVNWEEEKDCFKKFAQETASYYAQLRDENVLESPNWKWTTEHVFYPAIKEYFIPPKTFTESSAILQIADLPNLYKVFERC